jgi:hypothetical protein
MTFFHYSSSGRNITNLTNLADLGVGPNGTIQLELTSVDPISSPLKQYRPRQEYHMPDVISVKVQGGMCIVSAVMPEIIFIF